MWMLYEYRFYWVVPFWMVSHLLITPLPQKPLGLQVQVPLLEAGVDGASVIVFDGLSLVPMQTHQY
jgi:hypothetical protein